jgi:phenylalanine-4-hydroxylase
MEVKQQIYSDRDQQVWNILFDRQQRAVRQYAYTDFFPALQSLGLRANEVPELSGLNERLQPLTGWELYPVPGLIDNAYFFEQMRNKKFGSTTWLRKPEQLDYLEEPDMFHDIFGHVPLLTNEAVTNFLAGLAAIAANHHYRESVVEAIARLYWYTIEFGLVKEHNELKIYGAGILSSIGETSYCMGPDVKLLPFDVDQIIQTPYIKDAYQQQYFVLNDFAELEKGLVVLRSLLQDKFKPEPGFAFGF